MGLCGLVTMQPNVDSGINTIDFTCSESSDSCLLQCRKPESQEKQKSPKRATEPYVADNHWIEEQRNPLEQYLNRYGGIFECTRIANVDSLCRVMEVQFCMLITDYHSTSQLASSYTQKGSHYVWTIIMYKLLGIVIHL